MDSEEREIVQYLRSWGKEFVGVREICRRAGGKRRFHEDENWAVPILETLAERGVLERDAMGRYRLKPKPKSKSGGRWLSPEIAEILKTKSADLKEKGIEVETTSDDDVPEDSGHH
jgi:hypothetical protein